MDYENMSDEELLVACIGDEDAFVATYERFGPRVWAFARRVAPDCTRYLPPEDLLQEVFLRVFLYPFDPHRQTAGRPTTATAYLFRIVRSATIDLCRQLARAPRQFPEPKAEEESSPSDSLPDVQPTAEDLAVARERIAALQDCIDQLPEHYRAVIQLVYIEGMTFAEAASVLEIPLGTAQGRSHRGRQLLEECLRQRNVV